MKSAAFADGAFFIGIEFVSNRATKQPFLAHRRINIAIGRRAFRNGLICCPCAGNMGKWTGRHGDCCATLQRY